MPLYFSPDRSFHPSQIFHGFRDFLLQVDLGCLSAPHLKSETKKSLGFLEGGSRSRRQLHPVSLLSCLQAGSTPGLGIPCSCSWDGFGLVIWTSRCLHMDLWVPCLSYCQGNRATRLSQQSGKTEPSTSGGLHHPSPGATVHTCHTKRPSQPLSYSSD